MNRRFDWLDRMSRRGRAKSIQEQWCVGCGLQIEDNLDAGDAGRNIMQIINPLATHGSLDIAEARDIAAGSRDAGREAGANGVRNVHKHNRNGAGRCL
jgi:hypothetical protein